MTLTECYEAIGGNYEEVISRLGSERLVQKFVLKFLDDGSYDLLCSAMEEKKWDEAFRAAHTIKGICQNLGFTALQVSDEQLTEALRAGHVEEAVQLKGQVDQDYQRTAEGIRAFQQALS